MNKEYKKNIVKILFVLVLCVFAGLYDVLGLNIDNYTSSFTETYFKGSTTNGGGATPTQPKFSYKYSTPFSSNPINGIRVAVTNPSGSTLSSGTHVIDVITNPNSTSLTVTNGQYVKTQYNKNGYSISWGKTASTTNHVYNINTLVSNGTVSDSFGTFLGWYAPEETIDSWLKKNNSQNLASLIELTGYTAYDDADLVVVEVLFAYGNKLGTAYELLNSGISGWNSNNGCSTTNSSKYTWETSYKNVCIDFWYEYIQPDICEQKNGKWIVKDSDDSFNCNPTYRCADYTGSNPEVSSSRGCEACSDKTNCERFFKWTSGSYKFYCKTGTKFFIQDVYEDINFNISAITSSNLTTYVNICQSSCTDTLYKNACKIAVQRLYNKNKLCGETCPTFNDYCNAFADKAISYNCSYESYYKGYGVVFRRAASTIYVRTNAPSFGGMTNPGASYSNASSTAVSNLKNKTKAVGIGVWKIKDAVPERYNLKIIKTYENYDKTTPKASGVTFELYKGGTFLKSATTTSTGQLTFENLTRGTYILKEKYNKVYSNNPIDIKCTGSACGSISNDTSTPKNINITIELNKSKLDSGSTKDITIKIQNKKTCYGMFDSIKGSMETRTKYYTYLYNDSNQNLNGLLNMANTTADTACKSYTSPAKVNTGCMSLQKTNTFSPTNLTNYSETIKYGSKYGYCNTSIEVKNNLDKEGTYNLTLAGYHFKDVVKSGEWLIRRINGVIAKGTLVRTCYLYDYAPDIDRRTISNNAKTEYQAYVPGITLDGKALNVSVTSQTPSVVGKTYTQTYNATYSIKPICGEYGDGELNINSSECRDLKYGIYTKYLDDGKKILKNTITYDNRLIHANSDAEQKKTINTCTYETEPEIVTREGKLNIEYRVIDTENPFPGESGTNTRYTGDNWCGTTVKTTAGKKIVLPDCTNRNNNVITNIINRPNSRSTNPIYTITLDAEMINKIKNYKWKNNKVYAYDDFDSLSCTNTECTSTMLKALGIDKN